MALANIPSSLLYTLGIVGALALWLLGGISEYGKYVDLCWHM